MTDFVFSEENFRAPKLPSNLNIVDVPLVLATDENLKGFGKVRDVEFIERVILLTLLPHKDHFAPRRDNMREEGK